MNQPPDPEPGSRHTRSLALRVLAVQALTLLALWLLQATFGGA